MKVKIQSQSVSMTQKLYELWHFDVGEGRSRRWGGESRLERGLKHLGAVTQQPSRDSCLLRTTAAGIQPPPDKALFGHHL